jgi:RNA polymerase sigma-70 factor (ECF subfamily)
VTFSDEQLLDRIQMDDNEALEELLRRHASTVYRFGVRMCRNHADAEDVLQETLIAAARGIKTFRRESSVPTWLHTIARSFCIKKRRTSKFAPKDVVSFDDRIALDAPTTEPAPDHAASDRELSTLLESAIEALDETSREVLVLRDVEGLTAPEVGEVLGLSVDAVKSRLHRARAAVRVRVEAALPATERPSHFPAATGCPDIVSLFSRHLEGEIGAVDCDAMQAHLATCRRCDAACGSLKRTLALCRAAPQGDVPAPIQALVRRALREFTLGTPAP